MTDNNIKRFTLRIDTTLFETIIKDAKFNKRAIGKQMEFILEQHYKKENKC